MKLYWVFSILFGLTLGFFYLVFLIFSNISWRASVSSIVAFLVVFLYYLYFEDILKK